MVYFLWFYQSRYGPLAWTTRENKTVFTDGKEGHGVTDMASRREVSFGGRPPPIGLPMRGRS
jgi:hypothetical protein